MGEMGEMGEIGDTGEGGGSNVLPELTLKSDDLGEEVEDTEDAAEEVEDEIRRTSPSWNRPKRGKVNPPGFVLLLLEEEERADPVVDKDERLEGVKEGDGKGEGPEDNGEDGLEDVKE
jgi:hypothetical protein